MERERLALADTIESLRNEVESMWNDIQYSFDKIDRELDQTINRYKISSSSPSPYNPLSTILYESEQEENDETNQQQLEQRYNNKLLKSTQHSLNSNSNNRLRPMEIRAINSNASSISSASSNTNTTSSFNSPHRQYHNRQLSPIQQEFHKYMQRSPAPPRAITANHNNNNNNNINNNYDYNSSAYTTPIQSHIISSPYYIRNRIANYDSNYSEATDENISAPNSSLIDNSRQTPTIDIRLSRTTKQLAQDLNDFNRNDINDNLSVDMNIPGDVPGLDPLQRSFQIDLTNPKDSPPPVNSNTDSDNNNIYNNNNNHINKNHHGLRVDDDDIDIGTNSIRDNNNSDHEDGPQIVNDNENRMALINRISSHLDENSQIFTQNDIINDPHQRNNTEKDNLNHYEYLQDYNGDDDEDDDEEEDDEHEDEDEESENMNIDKPISSVTTPHSSPPSQSVEKFMNKSKKRDKIQPEFQYHKTPPPPIYQTLNENETLFSDLLYILFCIFFPL